RLAGRWGQLAEAIGLPAYKQCGAVPEPVLRQYSDQFPNLLDFWPSRWQVLENAIKAAGLRWDFVRAREGARSAATTPFDSDIAIISGRLKEAIGLRLALARKDRAEKQLAVLASHLAPHRGPVCLSLANAVRRQDPTSYEISHGKLLDLC